MDSQTVFNLAADIFDLAHAELRAIGSDDNRPLHFSNLVKICDKALALESLVISDNDQVKAVPVQA